MLYIQQGNNLMPRVDNRQASKIKFNNLTTKNEFILSKYDLSASVNFYKFNFSAADISNFEVGQYNYYVLSSNNDILASGIAQYGNYTTTHDVYDTSLNIITYEH